MTTFHCLRFKTPQTWRALNVRWTSWQVVQPQYGRKRKQRIAYQWSNSSSTVVCAFVAAEMCLLSRYLGTDGFLVKLYRLHVMIKGCVTCSGAMSVRCFKHVINLINNHQCESKHDDVTISEVPWNKKVLKKHTEIMVSWDVTPSSLIDEY
jgi:hypothetical protein